MRIEHAPDIEAKRASAEQTINGHFNGLAMASLHVDAAHHRKREEASSFLAGTLVVPFSFQDEAKRAGISLEDFAKKILAKDDEFGRRENARRLLIEGVRAATTFRGISDLLATNGIREGHKHAIR
jgi:hypothetical protein